MQTDSPKDDPRQIIRDVAKITGGEVDDDFKLSWQPQPCYSINCNDPIAVAEEAAANGLRGAHWTVYGNHYIVYWPKVSNDSSPDPLRV